MKKNIVHDGVEDFYNEGDYYPRCNQSGGNWTVNIEGKGVTCKKCLGEVRFETKADVRREK